MKKMFYVALFAIPLFSCGTTYYQMYKADYSPAQNPDISVAYDFWGEGGNMAFTVTNKTDKVITVKWEKSFFILNGRSIPYYDNTVVSQTEGVAVRNPYYSNVTEGSSTTVTQRQQPEIRIAPRASHPFVTYKINERFISIGNDNAPKKKEVYRNSYTESNTPIKFSNFITYQVEGQGENNLTDNFYVKEISIWHEKNFSAPVEWVTESDPNPDLKYYERTPLGFYWPYYIGM